MSNASRRHVDAGGREELMADERGEARASKRQRLIDGGF
jgi:hypothetical protein